MKFKKTFLAFLLILTALANALPQVVIPNNYFRSPINIGLAVSGSFGEVRPNHFHSGIDFPVGQKEGLPVFAIADGFVSRIKVSPVGFGNALYIDHPNGFTSVYAHLKGYNDTITEYIHFNQYKVKKFEVDLFPANKKEFIFVKKGQLIGYAGNSGSSGGPHLHFEIRNTNTERILNPSLFEFSVQDNFPPYIDFIKLYPDNESSYVGSTNGVVKFMVNKSGKNQNRLTIKDTLALWGNIYFGIQAYDYHHNQSNRNGWYSVKMYKDNEEFFSMVCDSFAFAESRYVNASIDYEDNYNNGSRIVISKKLKGNQLSFFKTSASQGVLNFVDSKTHKIDMQVSDLAGNTTYLTFWVMPQRPNGYIQVPSPPVSDSMVYFKYNKANIFETPELKVEIPLGSLYDNIVFQYNKTVGLKNLFSAVHYLHQPVVPLHSKIKVSINAANLPQKLQSKALLVRIDREGKRSSSGGEYLNGYVTTYTNLFDGYAIGIDTISPTIVYNSGNTPTKSLRFTVSDNFSGISEYRGELNGNWVLVEWDPKNKLMVYTFDDMLQNGKNTFILYLADSKGNKSSKKVSFNYSN